MSVFCKTLLIKLEAQVLIMVGLNFLFANQNNFFFLAALISLLATSCVSNKKIPYFKDIADTTSAVRVKEYPYLEPTIQADDILTVTIQTIDPQTSIVLNQIPPPIPSVGTSSASAIGSQVVTGFPVDKDGTVELPMIGKVKVGGLTTAKAREIIKEKASVYFKTPTVSVRYANYTVTVLGEVAKPGTYTMPNEKVSILDVLGLSGDLTIYGKRENVMLIRENGIDKEI